MEEREERETESAKWYARVRCETRDALSSSGGGCGKERDFEIKSTWCGKETERARSQVNRQSTHCPPFIYDGKADSQEERTFSCSCLSIPRRCLSDKIRLPTACSLCPSLHSLAKEE